MSYLQNYLLVCPFWLPLFHFFNPVSEELTHALLDVFLTSLFLWRSSSFLWHTCDVIVLLNLENKEDTLSSDPLFSDYSL
jgi:hypothetical protein